MISHLQGEPPKKSKLLVELISLVQKLEEKKCISVDVLAQACISVG